MLILPNIKPHFITFNLLNISALSIVNKQYSSLFIFMHSSDL